jgi:hypothetical protein
MFILLQLSVFVSAFSWRARQKGAQASYGLCVKAILAMVLEENSMQDIFNQATQKEAAYILLALLNVLFPQKD